MQQVAERVAQAVDASRPACRPCSAGPTRRASVHEALEQPALRRAGVLHADRHAGQQPLEDARRREVVGRADLLQVDHHRRRRLGAVDDVAAGQPLRVGEDVLADPGQRQVGQHFLVVASACRSARRPRARSISVKCVCTTPFGLPVVPEVKNIAATSSGWPARDLGVEEAGVRARRRRGRRRAARRAMPAPARRSCAGRAGRRTRCARSCGHCARISSSLSTCSWSSTIAKRDLGVVDREHELGGRRVLVQRHRNRAQRLRGEHRRRTAAAGCRRSTTRCWPRCKPGCGQAAGQVAHQRAPAAPSVSVCQMPNSFSRNAGASGRCAAWSSSRRGKVVCTGRLLVAARRRASCRARMLGRSLTPGCRSDDNPRVCPARDFPDANAA